MNKPRLYSDFNGPWQTHMLLTYVGTLRDLNTQKIILREGMEVTVYSDSDDLHDIEMDGVVCFGPLPDPSLGRHSCWYVRTNTDSLRSVPVTREEETGPFMLPCFGCGTNIYELLNSGECPVCRLDVEHARKS